MRSKKHKRWRVTLLRREQIDSDAEILVSADTAEEAKRLALDTACRQPGALNWNEAGSETESLTVDKAERI